MIISMETNLEARRLVVLSNTRWRLDTGILTLMIHMMFWLLICKVIVFYYHVIAGLLLLQKTLINSIKP